jgi:hypothetical protein
MVKDFRQTRIKTMAANDPTTGKPMQDVIPACMMRSLHATKEEARAAAFAWFADLGNRLPVFKPGEDQTNRKVTMRENAPTIRSEQINAEGDMKLVEEKSDGAMYFYWNDYKVVGMAGIMRNDANWFQLVITDMFNAFR